MVKSYNSQEGVRYVNSNTFVEAAALRSIVLRYTGAPISTRVSFSFFGDVAFSEYFIVPFPLSLCMESTSYVLSFRMMFFYLVTTGWIFYISLYENSINQSINVVVVVVFFTLTDRASTIPSNTRGCQSGTWSAGQKKIRGTSTKLQ